MDDRRGEQTDENDGGDTEAGDDPRWLRDLGPGHPLSPVPREKSEPVEPPDPDDDDRGEEETPDVVASSGDSTDATGGTGLPVSRRQALAGGAVAAVAGLAGVGWTLRGGPDGGHGVVESYVEAVADDDWAAAGALFHDRSSVGESDDSYEEFLESEGSLASLEAVTPTVEGVHDQFHVTDPVAAAENDDELIPDGLDPAEIEEWKQSFAVTAVSRDNVEGFGQPDDVEGLADATVATFPCTTVRDDDWQLFAVQTAAFG